jgi:hypothetical protein
MYVCVCVCVCVCVRHDRMREVVWSYKRVHVFQISHIDVTLPSVRAAAIAKLSASHRVQVCVSVCVHVCVLKE